MSGGGTGTSKDQLALQNKLTQDQLNQQKQIRDQIMQATSQYTTGAGQGYDPAQFSAMISSFLNQNSQNFGQARGQVLAGINARGGGGGDQPIGGDYARSLEGLAGAQAANQSQGVLGANIQNLQQAINNKFNALGLQSGQGAQLGQNIGVFNQGASNALGDYVKASQGGFLNSFAQGLGGALAAGAGGGIASSIGKLPSLFKSGGSNTGFDPGSIGFCWIAESLYGANDVRTHATRKYLTGEFGKTVFGRLFVAAYKLFGQRIAKGKYIKRALRPLFDRFSRKGMALLPKARIDDFESVWYQR